MDFEKLVSEIMAECAKDGEPITREDAEQMAQMELGAKEIKNYTQAENTKKAPKKPKVVHISQEKQKIFEDIVDFLQKDYNICIEKENKLLKITENGKVFKLDLIETRQK